MVVTVASMSYLSTRIRAFRQPVIISAGEAEVGSRMSSSACGESVISAMSTPSEAADEGRGILNMMLYCTP